MQKIGDGFHGDLSGLLVWKMKLAGEDTAEAVLDRLVYGLNKFYGKEKGPALGAGMQVAVLTTCGYRPERGSDLFEESVRRYCKHSNMLYHSMLVERHLGYHTIFFDEEKEQHVRSCKNKKAPQTVCEQMCAVLGEKAALPPTSPANAT